MGGSPPLVPFWILDFGFKSKIGKPNPRYPKSLKTEWGDYLGAGPLSAGFAGRVVKLTMATGSTGVSPFVAAPTIASATSIPLTTCPNAVYFLSDRKSVV